MSEASPKVAPAAEPPWGSDAASTKRSRSSSRRRSDSRSRSVSSVILRRKSRIRASVERPGIDPAERILGRLEAQLEYAELPEIIKDGVGAYLEKIQEAVAETAAAIQKTYFLH